MKRHYHYLADYEAYLGGRPVLWGQLALTWTSRDGEALDPGKILEEMQRMAAEKHGVDAQGVRIRMLAKL